MNFDIEKFAQEHECIFGNSLITIKDKITGEIFKITIEEAFNML